MSYLSLFREKDSDEIVVHTLIQRIPDLNVITILEVST